MISFEILSLQYFYFLLEHPIFSSTFKIHCKLYTVAQFLKFYIICTYNTSVFNFISQVFSIFENLNEINNELWSLVKPDVSNHSGQHCWQRLILNQVWRLIYSWYTIHNYHLDLEPGDIDMIHMGITGFSFRNFQLF